MDNWDWELLQQQQEEEETIVNNIEQQFEEKPISFSYDNNDNGVICSDYFSNPFDRDYIEDGHDTDSSDNPSWIDPTNITISVGSGQRTRLSSSNSDSSGPTSETLQIIESNHLNCDYGQNPENPLIDTQENDDGGQMGEVNEESDTNSGSKEEKKVVWWKVPLEVLKYCVLRVSPVWSLSMAAAALMGFIMFRRRFLYKMKRKVQGLQLKVTVDDKKVSQFKSRVARLNEAFSVVKRVPVIRPSLPSPGLAPWPVVSMR